MDAQAGQCLCCLHASKSDFLAPSPIIVRHNNQIANAYYFDEILWVRNKGVEEPVHMPRLFRVFTHALNQKVFSEGVQLFQLDEGRKDPNTTVSGPAKRHLNAKANFSDNEAPFLDLNLSISNGIVSSKRGSYMVWEINMGVCPRMEFITIMCINCLGYDFYINCAFEFLYNSIANL